MLDLDDRTRAASELLELIEAHLRSTGMTMSEFSRQVTGHDALIKNLRKGSLPSADKIARIAELIGYEFYFGPPRCDESVDNDAPAASAAPGPASPADAAARRLDRIEAVLADLPRRLEAVAERAGSAGPYRPVPLYSLRAAAGDGAAVDLEEVETTLSFRRDWLQAHGLAPDRCGLIRVSGDSMSPTLWDNDVVLLDLRPQDVLRQRCIYLFRQGDDLQIKRVKSVDGAAIRLAGDNPDWPEFDKPPDMAVIGRVVWSARTYDREPAGFTIVR